MAQVHISPELLAQMLFPGLDVEITECGFDRQRGEMILEIEGADVPDADTVNVTIQEFAANHASRRTHKAVVVPVEAPKVPTEKTRWCRAFAIPVTHEEGDQLLERFSRPHVA